MSSTEPPVEPTRLTYCDTCNQQIVESVSSRRYSHEDMHDGEQRAFMAGYADGERAAAERIMRIIKGFHTEAIETRQLVDRDYLLAAIQHTEASKWL